MNASDLQDANPQGSLHSVVSLRDCLDEINNAMNYWYPLKHEASEEERNARHVRLFQFRDRLEAQLKNANGALYDGDEPPQTLKSKQS